jgi:hypothetical protein
MRTAIIAVMALCAAAGSASAQDKAGPSNPTVDYSQSVGTTPVQIVPAAGLARQFQRLVNSGSTSQGTLWCSRSLTTTLSPNSPGAYPLAPYGNSLGQPSVEEFSTPTQFVPNTATWCVSASGTAIVTAEVSPR